MLFINSRADSWEVRIWIAVWPAFQRGSGCLVLFGLKIKLYKLPLQWLAVLFPSNTGDADLLKTSSMSCRFYHCDLCLFFKASIKKNKKTSGFLFKVSDCLLVSAGRNSNTDFEVKRENLSSVIWSINNILESEQWKVKVNLAWHVVKSALSRLEMT